MNTKLYIIKCLTNLHVGNGDVNFNVIDNEVERDPVTGYPTINASGVKGALRAHFEALNVKNITDIFGAPNDKTNSFPGKVKIFGANMLAIPMRVSKGTKPYELITTDEAVDNLNRLTKALIGKDISISYLGDATAEVEGITCGSPKEIFGETLYTMDNDSFASIPLPVVARNCLDKNNSNLWYEEIVPHESVMYFFVSSSDDTAMASFAETLKNNNIVQFGGNASIGFGVCKVEEGTFNEQKAN